MTNIALISGTKVEEVCMTSQMYCFMCCFKNSTAEHITGKQQEASTDGEMLSFDPANARRRVTTAVHSLSHEQHIVDNEL